MCVAGERPPGHAWLHVASCRIPARPPLLSKRETRQSRGIAEERRNEHSRKATCSGLVWLLLGLVDTDQAAQKQAHIHERRNPKAIEPANSEGSITATHNTATNSEGSITATPHTATEQLCRKDPVCHRGARRWGPSQRRTARWWPAAYLPVGLGFRVSGLGFRYLH